MGQIQKQRTKQTQEQEPEEDIGQKEADTDVEAHKVHTDELLDEIDSILEENAAQFVREYVQAGGE